MKNKILNVEITTEKQRNELVKQLQEMEFKKELPKSWDEYIKKHCKENPIYKRHLAIFLSHNLTPKYEAMYKLEELMAVYNDGWEPDWDSTQNKYTINREGNNIRKNSLYFTYSFLAFKDELTRDAFFTNFQPLIRQFFELDGN